MRKKKLATFLLISIRWVIVLHAVMQFVPNTPDVIFLTLCPFKYDVNFLFSCRGMPVS